MKTLATVALLIVGFSYVTYAYPPTLGTVNQCCGPQPEDLRSYYHSGSGVIIPAVEGENGMIITDIVCNNASACTLYNSDFPGTPIAVLDINATDDIASVHLSSGIPVPAGAEITVSSFGGSTIISGYVY